MNLFTFDIETSAQPESELLAKFEPKFEPDSRLKDPEKIAASIAEKKEAWLDESALHAERGQLLAIGWITPDVKYHHVYQNEIQDEASILDIFVTELEYWRSDVRPVLFCGFSHIQFDLPFIRRRCLIHGIRVPWYKYDKWKPWKFETFDAMLDWQSGNNRDSISLDKLARALGVGQKTGNGADFAKLFATDRDAALAYLKQDVTLTHAVCKRMLS